MSWLAEQRALVTFSAFLIAAGMLRSSWATRLDGFTIDEPWHITAGVAYLRTGEYYLNPEHPPLVKLVAALAAPPMYSVSPNLLAYKTKTTNGNLS